MEACAVIGEGRGNARHLYLNRNTLPASKKLFDGMMASAKTVWGEDFRPYTVLQLTHSGRYSKSNPDATAIVAVAENPYLDPKSNPNRRFITDKELNHLEDQYVETALLASEIGFDAVDIKACHRYLISELLSAHTREGMYGGSFENRIRFLLNIIDKVKAQVDIDVTLRINAYDALPYPYGWGTDENGRPSLDEPRRLMQILWEKDVRMVNISAGNPYFNPHIGRPADMGSYVAPEHPIESAARMLNIIKEMKAVVPDMALVGTGFGWFREYGANIAAGCIGQGWMDIAGFGRQSFAYPDFARDIITQRTMLRNKSCITCTKCTELMRFGGQTGCVVKDSNVYLPLWREATNGRTMMSTRVGNHV
jgi:2,4-dienoyl-CoA reductase-like NADH-dependent reductase (Old Yellow Enzyme family)